MREERCSRPYCGGVTVSCGINAVKDLVVIRDKQQDQNMVPHFSLHQREISRLCLLFHALIPGQLFSHAVLSKAENESGHPEVTWFYPRTCWKAFPQALWVFRNDVRKNIFCICFVLFLRASGWKPFQKRENFGSGRPNSNPISNVKWSEAAQLPVSDL